MNLLPRDKRVMPWRIEDELRKIGANYIQAGLWRGFAVRDGNLVTGQQNFSGAETAEVIIDALRRRYPQIAGPSREDICYATQNRQEAVKDLVPEADVVLVLGSRNSSNSLRLAEIAKGCGKRAYLIDSVREIADDWVVSAAD